MSLSSVAAGARHALAFGKAKKGDVVAVSSIRSSTGAIGSGVKSTREEVWKLAVAASVNLQGVVTKLASPRGAIAVKHYDLNARVYTITQELRQAAARKVFEAAPAASYGSQKDLQAAIIAALGTL